MLFFAYLTLANLVPRETRMASPLLPDQGLRLGLDLQGGIHWVLGVKLGRGRARRSSSSCARTSSRVAEGRWLPSWNRRRSRTGVLTIVAASPADAEKVREWAGRTGSLAKGKDEGTQLEYSLSSDGDRQRSASAAWSRCSRCCAAASRTR